MTVQFGWRTRHPSQLAAGTLGDPFLQNPDGHHEAALVHVHLGFLCGRTPSQRALGGDYPPRSHHQERTQIDLEPVHS